MLHDAAGRLSSAQVAARTGLRTRQSVHDWRRKGRIVGWQNARRSYVFPAEQLDERNRPLCGTRLCGRAVRRRLRRVGLADDATGVARWGGAARAPGAGRGRARRCGREGRPAGRLSVTRGYGPERLRAGLLAIRIERMFRVVHLDPPLPAVPAPSRFSEAACRWDSLVSPVRGALPDGAPTPISAGPHACTGRDRPGAGREGRCLRTGTV